MLKSIMDLRIGELDEILTVRNSTFVKDGYGGLTETWVNTNTFRASVKPLSGTEQTKDALEVSQQNYQVKCRHRTDVTPDSRLVWRGVEYQVVSATNEKRKGVTIIEMRLIAKI